MTKEEMRNLGDKYGVFIKYDEYYKRYLIWIGASLMLKDTPDYFFIDDNDSTEYEYVYVEGRIVEWFERFYPMYIRKIKVKTILEN